MYLHHNSNVIVHILADIPQKGCCHDTHAPKRNARVVHILVCSGVGQPPCSHDDLVRGFIVANSRKGLEFVKEGDGGVLDGGLDEFGGCDVEFGDHGAANVVDGGSGEFVDKHL